MHQKLIIAAVLLMLPGAVFAWGTSAGTYIWNGGDSGTALISSGNDSGGSYFADTWGDVIFEYHSEFSETYYAASDSVSALVDTGYDIDTIANYDTQYKGKGDTLYLSYSIVNRGNAVDSIGLRLDTVSGSGFYLRIYRDTNRDGTHQASELSETNFLTLAPNAGDSIFVAVIVPASASFSDSVIVRLRVVDGATTAGDSWPSLIANARDVQFDTFALLIQVPMLYVQKTVDTTTFGRKPGDTLIYTVYYDNDGNGTATNVVIYDVLPQFTTWVVNSIDTVNIHDSTAGSATIAVDTDYSGAFTAAEDSAVRRVKITLLTNVGPNDGDAEGTVQAVTGGKDSGWIRFRVTIN